MEKTMEELDVLSPKIQADSLQFSMTGLSRDPITKWHVQSNTFYELEILRKLSHLTRKYQGETNGNWIVDAGANIGNHTLYLAGMCTDVKVVSFEMNPVTFEFLKRNVISSRLSNIEIVNVGLSDSSGVCGIRQNADNPLGGAQLDFSKPGQEVKLITLDHFVKEAAQPSGKCLLIKLDVEGHEVNVLRGAKLFLEFHRPIIFVEIKEVNEFKEITDFLSVLGYVAVYADDSDLPNFLFAHKDVISVMFSNEDLHMIRQSLCARVVDSWQLHRKIKTLLAK